MKNLITFAVLSLTFASNAQSTLIEYDYQTEQYTFYKISKKGKKTQIKRPFSYEGIPTTVVVKNLNTFSYDVGFTTEHSTTTPISGDQDMESLTKSFGEGYSAFSGLVGEVKSSDIYGSLFADGKFQGLEGIKGLLGLGMAASEFEDKLENLEEKGELLESTQSKIARANKELLSTFEQIQLIEFVNDQLIKLQQNRSISPEEMKTRADVLIRKLVGEPSLENVITATNNQVNAIKSGYNNYKNSFGLYSMQEKEIERHIEEFKAQVTEADYMMVIESFEMELKADYAEISDNMDALNTLMDEYSINYIRQGTMMAYENYDKIMHADFDFEYSLNTNEDMTRLTMEFYPVSSNDSSAGDEVKAVKVRTLDVPVKGGLRINSSAGLSFLRYMNGHDSYNADGGTIRAVEGDAFIPALTTMFHFYGQSYRPVSFGGAFGVSVPTEGDKDFIYMLGSSTIFGKSQRVILNVGAFGGKIDRLDGYKVGDSITAGSIVPTKKVFDFGIYAGITFNINKLF